MRALAVAALASAALVAGCGAQAVDDDAPSLDQVAAATRADAYGFEGSLEIEGIADEFTAAVTGEADPVGRRGVIRYRFDDGGDEYTLEVRRIGEETYTSFSGKGKAVSWSRESTSEADELTGPFGAFSEPHRAVDALARHGREVESEPGEVVDGVATTHFRATVPTIELFAAGATKERRAELEDEIRETGSESSEVEAWAGADGLLRRLEFRISISEDGERGRMVGSTRFFDFGKQVEVEAPPASDVDKLPRSGACRTPAAPHSPESVMKALRDAGFTLDTACFGGETMIIAAPKGRVGERGIVCSVGPGPGPPEDVPNAEVAGNVACVTAAPAERAIVRKLLDGL